MRCERIGKRQNPLLLKEGCLRALRAGGVVKMICCLKKPPRLRLRRSNPLLQKEGIFAPMTARSPVLELLNLES